MSYTLLPDGISQSFSISGVQLINSNTNFTKYDKEIKKQKKMADEINSLDTSAYAWVDEYGIIQIKNTPNTDEPDISDEINYNNSDFNTQDNQEIESIKDTISQVINNIDNNSVSNTSNLQLLNDNSDVGLALGYVANKTIVNDSPTIHYNIVSKNNVDLPSVNGYEALTSSTWENDIFLYQNIFYKNGSNYQVITNRTSQQGTFENLGFEVFIVDVPQHYSNYEDMNNWAVQKTINRLDEIKEGNNISLPLVDLEDEDNKIETTCCLMACLEPNTYVLV